MSDDDNRQAGTTNRRRMLGATAGILSAGVIGSVPASGSEGVVTTAGGSEVSANEVRFAKGELPNYKRGSILNGDHHVVATESGDPPAAVGDAYDVAISHRELFNIEERLIDEYIDEFGVDPSDPKVQVVDGDVYTKSEIKSIVERKEMTTTCPSSIESEEDDTPPDPIGDTIRVHSVEAADSEHKPSEAWLISAIDGWSEFDEFGLQPKMDFHYGSWEPTGTGITTADQIDHLRENKQGLKSDYELVTGWVDKGDHNGRADVPGHFSVNAVTTDGLIEWPHDVLIQHELSHNFGAEDQGTTPVGHDECIMNYWYAYNETHKWCDDTCHSDVESGI